MATSGILNAINSALSAAAAIPYDWGTLSIAQSTPAKLFQLVAVWNDQVNREKSGEGYTFAKPACFLELEMGDATPFLENVSYQEMKFKFRIVDMQLDAADGTMDQNLSVFEYRDLLKNYMVGMAPDQCSTLFYVEEQQDYSHTDIYHYIICLKCGFTDLKGSSLDPNQVKVIYKEPDTDMILNIGYGEPPAGTDPLTLEITPP